MAKSKFLAKKTKFQFKWYTMLVIILVIAIVGITALYYSQASSGSTYYDQATMTGGQPIFGTGSQSNVIVARALSTAIPVSFSQDLPTNTTQTLCVQLKGVPDGGTKIYTLIGISNDSGGQGSSSDQFVDKNGWFQLYQDNWQEHYSKDGPTAKISTSIAGSNGTNLAVPSSTVEVLQFAITSNKTPCPTN